MSDPDRPPVILASTSKTRSAMLANAGVVHEIQAAGVDESSVKESLAAEGASVTDVAVALAELKALSVSRRRAGALVIGADQMLECNGIWFDKPQDRAHAAAHLRAFSGKDHRLISAVVVAIDGARIWHSVDKVTMSVRELGDDFISSYLDQAGDAVLPSVGAYQLEGIGAQLFTAIRGDYFSVLGMPLLPLLEFMRVRGVLER